MWGERFLVHKQEGSQQLRVSWQVDGSSWERRGRWVCGKWGVLSRSCCSVVWTPHCFRQKQNSNGTVIASCVGWKVPLSMLGHVTVLILLPQGASLKMEVRPGQQPLPHKGCSVSLASAKGTPPVCHPHIPRTNGVHWLYLQKCRFWNQSASGNSWCCFVGEVIVVFSLILLMFLSSLTELWSPYNKLHIFETLDVGYDTGPHLRPLPQSPRWARVSPQFSCAPL